MGFDTIEINLVIALNAIKSNPYGVLVRNSIFLGWGSGLQTKCPKGKQKGDFLHIKFQPCTMFRSGLKV